MALLSPLFWLCRHSQPASRLMLQSARKLILACLCLSASFVSPSTGAAQQRVFSEADLSVVSPIYETFLILNANSTYQLWTDTLQPIGACAPDTVMHVVDFSTGAWIGSNDDCMPPGLSSCLTVNTGPNLVVARVFVHGFSTCSMGSATFHATGPGMVDPAENMVFGGMVFTAPDVGWSTTDRLHTVPINNGLLPGSEFRVIATGLDKTTCDANSVSVQAVSEYGPLGTMLVDFSTNSSSVCFPRFVVGTSLQTDVAASGRMYLNDAAATDADGDGLGDMLEAELGSCGAATIGQPPPAGCEQAINPSDTDRDGLPDAGELFGLVTDPVFLSGEPLPLWGANIRKKDVFVEIDWAQGSTPLPADRAAGIASVFAAGTPASSHNPDGTGGITAHFDTGVNSCDAQGMNCSTTYGAWGGGGVASAATYQASGLNDMLVSRRGIFLHGLKSNSAGCSGGGQATGWRFGAGAQDGAGCTNSAVAIFAHEIGHCMGLRHGGLDNDTNCKPNYESIMNYAYNYTMVPPGFSTGQRASLNVMSAAEDTGIGEPAGFMSVGFDFQIAGNGVDWNRNGTIEQASVAGVLRAASWSATKTCRAPWIHETANLYQGGFKQRAEMLALVDETNVAPQDPTLRAYFRNAAGGIVRAGFRSSLIACTTNVPANPPGCCRTDDVFTPCEAPSGWDAVVQDLHTGAVTSAPAAAVMFVAAEGGLRTVVVYTKSTGATRRLYALPVDAGGQTGAEVSLGLQPFEDAAAQVGKGDPAAVFDPISQRLILLYVSTTADLVRIAEVNSNLAVVSDNLIVDALGARYASAYTPALAYHDFEQKLYAAIVKANGEIALLRQVANNTWEDVSAVAFAKSGSLFAGNRPTLQYDEPNHIPMLELWYADTGTFLKRLWMSNGSQFDHFGNVYSEWSTYHGGGAALARFQGQLQAVAMCDAVPAGVGCANFAMKHLPFANGLFPYVLDDHDDFQRMHEDACALLHGASQASALCCAPGGGCVFGQPEEHTCPGS